MKAAISAALLALVVALSTNADFYNAAMVDVFMAMALFGALVTLLVVQFSWIDLVGVASSAAFVAGIDYWGLSFQPKLMAGFSFLGLMSLTALGLRALWSGKEKRPLFLFAFLPVLLFVLSEYMASTMLDFTEALHPKTFDLYLYSFDCSLHVQPSFLIGQIYSRHLWFRFVGLLFYITLPLPIALVYAAHLRRSSKSAFPAMLAFLITGPLGILFYNLVPATGPVHVFGPGFPWHPLLISQARQLVLETIPVKGARNAIPSLHMAWVLLVWWNSKGLSRWIRGTALAFVAFTILATLGTGEHYFVDLVVAFPFALMVQSLCAYNLPWRESPRRWCFLFGIFASLLWMALVSFAVKYMWISLFVPWTLVITTVAASSWLVTLLGKHEGIDDSETVGPPLKSRSTASCG